MALADVTITLEIFGIEYYDDKIEIIVGEPNLQNLRRVDVTNICNHGTDAGGTDAGGRVVGGTVVGGTDVGGRVVVELDSVKSQVANKLDHHQNLGHEHADVREHAYNEDEGLQEVSLFREGPEPEHDYVHPVAHVAMHIQFIGDILVEGKGMKLWGPDPGETANYYLLDIAQSDLASKLFSELSVVGEDNDIMKIHSEETTYHIKQNTNGSFELGDDNDYQFLVSKVFSILHPLVPHEGDDSYD